MVTVYLNDTSMETSGELPEVGSRAPDFILTTTDLIDISQDEFAGSNILLNIYPSIDTSVCFSSVQSFNNHIANIEHDIIVACVSMDLPFALYRVSEQERFDNIVLLSDFRNRDFGENYGLTITNGPLAGLLARALVLINTEQKIIYTELISDLSQQPDYPSVLSYLS